jgi:glycosyltransferase involved in cell wall biosynthesis
MRIAELAPPWYPVPPRGYGGIELIVGLLVEGLVARGHDVTLFAAPGSETRARLVTPLDKRPDPSQLGNVWFDAQHALVAYLAAREFDIVHDHTGVVGPALGSMLGGRPPVVHTLHGRWNDDSRRYFELLQANVHLVAISEAQRRDNAALRYVGTVCNGIDVDAYPLVEDKDDFLVFVGRANPDKGVLQAIEAARRAGRRLVMIVKRREPGERLFWQELVVPQLHDGVEVLEDVSHELKVELLGRARAMVFPIQWPEPFGLVMIEAMACGTPVLACPVGAAVEIVEDGVTGFLRTSIEELVEAVDEAATCSPLACRERVAARYSAEVMVDGYERVFESVLGRGEADGGARSAGHETGSGFPT